MILMMSALNTIQQKPIEVGIKCGIMSTFKALMMSALNTTDQHNL